MLPQHLGRSLIRTFERKDLGEELAQNRIVIHDSHAQHDLVSPGAPPVPA